MTTPAPSPTPAAAVRSPCINVCRMEASSGWCEGCLRTIEEISAWSRLVDADRLAVLRRLPARRAERSKARAKASSTAADGTGSPAE